MVKRSSVTSMSDRFAKKLNPQSMHFINFVLIWPAICVIACMQLYPLLKTIKGGTCVLRGC